MKWSEILPQDALNLSVQLENYALEERSRGKVLLLSMGGEPIDWTL